MNRFANIHLSLFKFIQILVFALIFYPKIVYSSDSPLKYPLVIYSDGVKSEKTKKFIPSGCMGDFHALIVKDNCKIQPKTGKTCMKFTYKLDKPKIFGWVGVCWQYPANNWGNIPCALNLSGAKKLTFHARGEKGGEVITFKFGGNYGPYSDTTEIILGPVKLTKEWKKYTIELKNEDLSFISCGFSWIINRYEQSTNDKEITFYIDDIKIE